MVRRSWHSMFRTLAFCAVLTAFGRPALAASELLRGGTYFLPVYSHIYIGDRARPFLLAITVSVRNTSLTEPMTLTAADFYDSDGTLLNRYIDAPKTIEPFGSMRLTVAESEKHGGAGAKFLVSWTARTPVTAPHVEAVMIGSGGQQGISFTSQAIPLKVER